MWFNINYYTRTSRSFLRTHRFFLEGDTQQRFDIDGSPVNQPTCFTQVSQDELKFLQTPSVDLSSTLLLFVEHDEVKIFLKGMNPTFASPGLFKLWCRVIDMKTDLKAKKMSISDLRKGKTSLTVDAWSTSKFRGYTTAIAHRIAELWCCQTATLLSCNSTHHILGMWLWFANGCH